MSRFVRVLIYCMFSLGALTSAGVIAVYLSIVPSRSPVLEDTLRCHLGAYALADGRTLFVAAESDETNSFQFVLENGERGWLKPTGNGVYLAGDQRPFAKAAFDSCDDGRLTFSDASNGAIAGKRRPLVITDTTFASGDTMLYGKLVLPEGGHADHVVVWVQGSNNGAETNEIIWQFLLPVRGIGVFVYDKRGTGQSEGDLSSNFDVRASDTAAAVVEARRLMNGQPVEIGVFGGSQGGWVAPLTATKTSVDFVIVGYGMAEGVPAEDRNTVQLTLREAGYGPDVLAEAREITDATARIVKSGWVEGWSEFRALKLKYGDEPWVKTIRADSYTGVLLQFPTILVGVVGRVIGPLADEDVSFNYDPRATLESLGVPQLWILAAKDHSAPSEQTIRILRDLQARKPNLDLVVFKTADHGMVETYNWEDQQRRRYPAGYFDLIVEWITTQQARQITSDMIVFNGTP